MTLAKAFADGGQTGELEDNDVVIRGYTAVGSLQGMGKVEVEARESVIPDRRMVAYFVRVAVETMDDYPQTGAALIRFDHVPKLLTSLDKLAKANIKSDRFKYTEIEYEVDGLQVIVFNNDAGRTLFVVTAGGVSAHFNSVTRMPELRNLIAQAKEKIDNLKIEF